MAPCSYRPNGTTMRFSYAVPAIALATLTAVVSAKMLRGKKGAKPNEKSSTATGPLINGCTGVGCETLCDSEEDAIRASAVAATGASSEKCSCDLDGEVCSCSGGCSETAKFDVCTELLGECQCQRSPNQYCECFGYCHSTEDREDACNNAFGCGWTGQWCDVVTRLKFNEDTDSLEAAFNEGDDDEGEEIA
eukprot:TRINITY_DN114060_c0_g1_i1.p2 TRINITY_DN114060_c0_g1~~TRINITY_DN114060_c0_g1_i1.p2  ORF type:complete len:192 (+),score=35.80 TRINITY_DN114060_c0_g1_i1:139-714(+)